MEITVNIPDTRPSRLPEHEMAREGASLIAPEVIEDLLQLFKLLADETRLQILYILRQKEEVNVLTLCRLLGLRQPSVSHHLALLRVHKLIDMRREGKHNFYRILPEKLAEYVHLISTPDGANRRIIPLGGKMRFELVLQPEGD